MAPADWAILAVFVLSVFSGLRRGFFVTICSLIGVVSGFLLASRQYGAAAVLFQKIGVNQAIADALGFLLIAVVVMIIAGVVGRLLRTVFDFVGLGWADRLAGSFVGLLQGAIVITLLVMAIAAFLPHWSVLEDSRLGKFFLATAHRSTVITPAELGKKIRAGIKAIEDAQPVWIHPQA
jgi:membrane protein required for colicin V production